MINKRGSVSVFLVFIMAAMIGAAAAFVYAAKQTAYTGISDGVLNLAMRSVLSEYDLTLYERYGLMAFERNGMDAALEIGDYVDYSFVKDAPVKKIQVSFGNYSMADINNIEMQIIEYMKTEGLEYLINADKSNVERENWEDRTLRNQGLINSLPSKPFGEGAGIMSKVEQLKDQMKSADNILKETSGSYLMDSYIMQHFKYATGGPLNEKSFFQHEVEYILHGELSNEANREKTERLLKLIRVALNTAYLYSDSEKNAQTLAAAELLTPGAAPATQAAIITSWATAEASNDVKLLLKGRPVPIMKTDDSWATSLDNVLNNITDGYIETENTKGLYYDEYMRVFLHFMNEDLKVARVADLIQINMKAVQDRDFLMKTANEGLYLSTQVYGRERSYETSY